RPRGGGGRRRLGGGPERVAAPRRRAGGRPVLGRCRCAHRSPRFLDRFPRVVHAYRTTPAPERRGCRYIRSMLFGRGKQRMIEPSGALPGRDHRVFAVPATHEVLGTRLEPPFPDGLEGGVF